MDLSEPARSLSPTLHLAVLATLARTHAPVSGRGLARLHGGVPIFERQTDQLGRGDIAHGHGHIPEATGRQR